MKNQKLLKSLPFLLAAALAGVMAWYYDVYVHWNPVVFPFAVAASVLVFAALAASVIWPGEGKPGKKALRVLGWLAAFLALTQGVTTLINNVIYNAIGGARPAMRVVLPLLALLVILLLAKLWRAPLRRAWERASALKKATKRLIAALAACAVVFPPGGWLIARNSPMALVFDLHKQGKVIGGKFSDFNIWQMQGGWSERQPEPAQFAAAYPYAERLQIMTATGGNETRDLFINPNDRSTLTDYDFEPLLAACRNILALGMKPVIKTGAVPLKFCAEPIIGRAFGVNVLPPDDFGKYYTYIHDIALALIAEFGVGELKTWAFGVLTEFENSDWFYVPGPDGEPDPEASEAAYCKLYDYTVAALQDALGPGNLTVGAHAMQCAAGLSPVADFIDHCAKGTNYATGNAGTQLDYLAASFYSSSPGRFSGKDLAKTVGQLRKWAKDAGLTGLRFGVDEGRILCGADGKELSARVVAMSYQGAADAYMFKTMIDSDIDWFANWDGATNMWGRGAEPVSTHVAYLGGRMKNDRYIRPVVWGVPANRRSQVDGVGGYDSETKTARLMVYGYNTDPDATGAEKVRVTVKHIGGTKATVREYVIDDGNANFWPLWWEDQAARGLTDDDYGWSKYSNHPMYVLQNEEDRQFFLDNLARYQQAAALEYTEREVPVEGGRITLTPTLRCHGVVFYEITEESP
jgi:hypothetical protein